MNATIGGSVRVLVLSDLLICTHIYKHAHTQEDGGFIINEQRTPTFIPSLYSQHYTGGNTVANMQNSTFLQQYSFEPYDVVDWCVGP